MIEQKREAARRHKGVWYDARSDKFVAEVYSRGERHFLGTFNTVQQAADAYVTARAEMPTGRDTAGTFSYALETFIHEARRDSAGNPEFGQTMTYKDQVFTFDRITFRATKNGRKRAYYQWRSHCQTCGEEYLTITATAAKGITRNCEDHRAARGRRRPAEDQTDYWFDLIDRAAQGLALTADSVSVDAFIRHCREMAATEGQRLSAAPFEVYLRKDGTMLLRMKGDEIFFD